MFAKRRYVSFDVFDTCLIRRCGLPYKIWDLMADRLFDKDDYRGKLSFVGSRRSAEKRASEWNLYPSLSDIYSVMNVSQWGFEQKTVMELEMEIEEQELSPNPEMLRIVSQYREKGFKIAFVSDMYLPMPFIRRILVKQGFCLESDLVFVSAECKASKYNGKLFQFVFNETKTRAKEWIHYGDNKLSDYYVPKLKGVKVFHVSNTGFTDQEKNWIDEAQFYSNKHEIELWAGLCRLTRLQNEQNFAVTMAIDFIASLYIPYVVYVLRTAKKNGIKTLYFLARDAHIFFEIAKALKKESEGIECRYLKLSRRSLFACAFYNMDDYELYLTMGLADGQTVQNALKMIDVKYEELSNDTKSKFKPSFILNSDKKRKLFFDSLKRNDSEFVKRISKEKRSLFLEYLKQEKVLLGNVALVDLGWAGSSRCTLNYILKREKCSAIPTFYWGVCRGFMYGASDDSLYVFNRQHEFEYARGVQLLEGYASKNDCGSTTGYQKIGDEIVPIEDDTDAATKDIVQINESTVKKMTCAIPEHMMSDESMREVFYLCGLKQLFSILSHPSKKHIAFFEEIEFETFSVESKMIPRLSLKDFLTLFVWGRPASMVLAEAAAIKTFGPFAPFFIRFYKFSSQTAFANRLRLWWENRE